MFSPGLVTGRHPRRKKHHACLGPVLGAEATRSLPDEKTEKTKFAAWCRAVCHTMSSDSVLSGFYAVSYNLSICSWSHISFYGETSSVNIPSQILTPVVTMAKSFSSPRLKACTAASCRQQPHIEGQALPTGNVPSWAYERMTDVATHFFTAIVDHTLMAAYVPELWPLGTTWSLQRTARVNPTQLG